MAPPRKGTTATPSVVDDSRSEASNSTRELKGSTTNGSRSRKGPHPSGVSKSTTMAPSNVTSAPAEQIQEDPPKVRQRSHQV